MSSRVRREGNMFREQWTGQKTWNYNLQRSGCTINTKTLSRYVFRDKGYIKISGKDHDI